jgi:hypothetical protein
VTGANEVSSLPVTDQGNGAYSASYTPTQAGLDAAMEAANITGSVSCFGCPIATGYPSGGHLTSFSTT